MIALKVGLSNLKKNCVICFIETLLRMTKNAFYFILKALFVLEIFKFLYFQLSFNFFLSVIGFGDDSRKSL